MTQAPSSASGNESRRDTTTIQSTRDTGSATTSFAGSDADAQRRRELALFLKAKRAAVVPKSVGLPIGRRRRASGLLREEVAQRAGISPTWYTWLEQGREIKPSTVLLGDFAALAPADRNILRMIFLWNHWRTLFVDWIELAESVVAQCRAETARHSGAPQLLTLTDALAQDSADFARLWHARAVDTPQFKVKRLRHPDLGLVDLTYAPLRPRGVTDDLSVVVYSSRAA